MVDEIERNPNDAVILNYSQNPVEYQKVPKVWLTHPDSTEEDVRLVPFTYGEAVSKKVAPDFSNGDMPVEIPEGELVTELTVKKPEELVPENIPEGMYIAGVGPGLFQGGSGSGGGLDLTSIVTKTAEEIVSPTLPYVPSSYFSGWSVLRNVSLDRCSQIGTSAFLGCSNLQTVNIPECLDIGPGAFSSCSSLSCVEASKCENIGNYAFMGCTLLSNPAFPGCTSIGVGAFESCALDTIKLGSGLVSIPARAFQKCYSLKTIEADLSQVEVIENSAFYSCSLLSEIVTPKCRSVGDYAFYGAKNLRFEYSEPLMSVGSCVFTSNIYTYAVSGKGTYYSDIMIGWGATQTSAMEGVKTIAGYVFGRTALNMGTTTKTLPDSVEYISPYAFYGQTAFKLSATLPKLKSVGSHAFYGCDRTGVINIDAPECLYLGSYAFYRTSTTYAGPSRINTPKVSYVGNSCFYSGRSAPINLTLSSVAYIGSSAFYYCSNMIMTNAILSLTNSVIAASTFYSCSKLSTVMSLQGSVYASAFAFCSAISTVIMNAPTTKTISTFAFGGCRSLMSLYLLGSVVTLAATAAFQSTPLSLSTYTGSFGSIFVPESLYSSYLTRAYWSAYSSRFVSMTDTEIQEVLDYWNGVINS